MTREDLAILLLYLAKPVVSGAAGHAVGRRKGRRVGGILGFFLGVLGVGIMWLLRSRADAPPPDQPWYRRPDLLLSLLALGLTVAVLVHLGQRQEAARR